MADRTLQHFIGNEQETNRYPLMANGSAAFEPRPAKVAAISSNIDDRTMHELYLWPFVDAIRAGTGAIMCSYQRVNNSYSCQNSKALNGLLKAELGFEGFVVSDWFATHAGGAAALAGLDMEMPVGAYFGQNLLASVRNGSFPLSRLDDMSQRFECPWYHLILHLR